MEIKATEARTAARWFYVAGAVAVLLSYTLFRVDEALTNSKREENLGKTLFELRTAQTSLGSEKVEDPRQAGALLSALEK